MKGDSRQIIVIMMLVALSFSNLSMMETKGVSSEASLSIEKELISVEIGDAEYLKIQALDNDGNVEDFNISFQTTFFNATKLNTSYIRVTGISLGIDEITVSSASGISKDIRIRVFDPLFLDDGSGLLIAFVDQFSWKWDDSGSGADSDGRFSHPIVPSDSKYDGFYPLGSNARGDYSDPNNIDYAILVKDKDNASLLAKPLDFVMVYADWGSGADNDGSMWFPIAPEGYVAFGLVAQSGYSKPSTDSIRVVAEELTVQGKLGSKIWDDSGSGGDMDFTAYSIDEPDTIASEDGTAFLSTNTFVGAGSYSPDAVNLSIANLLHINLPTMEEYDDESEPKLTGYHKYESVHPRFYKSIFVPFTLIRDNVAEHDLHWKITNSPFYLISRVENYLSLDYFDNKQGSKDVTKTISFETGYSTTTTEMFYAELGFEISMTGSANFLGSKGEWTVKVTSKLHWESSVANTYSETTTKTTTYLVPAGKFVELLQVTTSFMVVTGNNFVVGELPMKSSGLKILEYPYSSSSSSSGDEDKLPISLSSYSVLLGMLFIGLITLEKRKKRFR